MYGPVDSPLTGLCSGAFLAQEPHHASARGLRCAVCSSAQCTLPTDRIIQRSFSTWRGAVVAALRYLAPYAMMTATNGADDRAMDIQ